jgi:hypothetical protein
VVAGAIRRWLAGCRFVVSIVFSIACGFGGAFSRALSVKADLQRGMVAVSALRVQYTLDCEFRRIVLGLSGFVCGSCVGVTREYCEVSLRWYGVRVRWVAVG